ncbi:MAG TPA: MFS transporter [Polyangiaceae bacterium]|nr:MFS transporter [Polyangiaceae bacterium]
MVPAARPSRTLPAPWWAVLTLPFGLTVGFATVAVPFVLRKRGFDMTVIATVSQVAQIPHVVKLLWSPALDSGPRRRTWYFASVGATAFCLALAALVPPSLDHRVAGVPLLWIYAAVLFGAQAAVATSGSAVLALMAVTVADSRRGAAAGWQTAGNLAGTAAGGALVAWMLEHLSPTMAALALAVFCAVAAVPAAFVDEPPLARRSAVALLARLAREIWATLRSPEGWTGLLICVSPVGAGALTNLFSALAPEYAPDTASAERLVFIVTGVLGGIVNAAGALLGGYVADRMNRRLAYVLFGAVTAFCALGMIAFSATPRVFTLGTLAYQFANGLCYAAFYAFVVELLGYRDGVTTQLALYVGASNFAITYVTWLDGYSYDRARAAFPGVPWAGRSAMLAMDALSTFVGIALLWFMMIRVRRLRARRIEASG